MVEEAQKALEERLGLLPRFALAFSGGLDSRFLAFMAKRRICEVSLLHVSGAHVPEADSAWAKVRAKALNFPFVNISFNPLDIPEIAAGDRLRCYFCKRAVLGKMREYLTARGDSALPLCDGTNSDDLKIYRPGRKACEEMGIVSPLNGLSKTTIRALARKLGMEAPDQKASPCLLTRFDYGIKPDLDRLRIIAAIEHETGRLLRGAGLPDADFRLRFTPYAELHMNYVPEKVKERLLEIARNHGLKETKIVFMENVGGYYDRKRSNG